MRLSVGNISFGYDERLVIDGCSFEYESPEAFCILGHNGTGKSTLLQCLIGAFHISTGSVLVDGMPVGEYSARKLARKIAYIPQSQSPTFAFPCIDVVTMGRTSRFGYLSNPAKKDICYAQEQMDYLDIGHLRDKPYTEISGGERQLVMIASALAQDPELMILDEPTAHLDFGNAYKFLMLVKKLQARGMGVLMTTHFPDHALLLHGKTAILNEGRITHIGIAKDIVNEENMGKLYDIEANVCAIGDRTTCIPGPLHADEMRDHVPHASSD